MDRTRYAPPLILIHWLTFLLFVAAYATIELREYYPKGSDIREALKAWHYLAGLTIFGLVWARLLFRIVLPRPQHGLPKWQSLASGLVHLALYALMIAMPLLGWLTLSAEGDPVLWLGIELPPLTAPNESLAEQAEALHETVGKAGYFLIGLHAAAALVHHYLLGDRTLGRILPGRPRTV